MNSEIAISLKQYFNKKLRLVIFIGDNIDKNLIDFENLIKFRNIHEITFKKLNYLKADLIIINNFTYNGLLCKNICKYTHDKGHVYIYSECNADKELKFLSDFQKTGIPKLYRKKQIKNISNIYNQRYLDKWGDCDFLTNWEEASRYILSHLPKHYNVETSRILDIGCLNGYIMESLRMAGQKNIYGCDISYDIAINNCVTDYHLSAINICDFCNNEYSDQFSDLTICMEVLEHIQPTLTEEFISEIARVTSNEGIILISTSDNPDIDITHVNCRSRIDWYKIFLKRNLIPIGRQVIFPGFNSFVLKKSNNKILLKLHKFNTLLRYIMSHNSWD